MGMRQAPVHWRFARTGARLATVPAHATANSWALLAELAAAGLGVARLPDYLATPAIARGEVVAVLEDYRPPPEQLFAVYPRARHVPARIAGFIDVLRAFFDVWPGCLVTGHAVGRGDRRAR